MSREPNAKVPRDAATHYLPAPDGRPQMFYRWQTIQRSDGTTHTGLEYLTHCGLWHGSMERDPHAFAASRLVPMPYVPHEVSS